MKPRDLAATLFLAGSALFLVSGLFWSALNVEEPSAAARESQMRPDADRGREGGAASPSIDPSRADGADSSSPASHGIVAAERSALEIAASGPSRATEYRLEGRVVGPDHEPVEQASVRLELRVAPRADAPIGRSEQPVLTGADGRFSFVGERLGELTLVLLVRAPRLSARLSEHAFQSGTTTLDVGDLELSRGGAIEGSIGDANGLAIPGASATLLVERSHPLASWSQPAELFDSAPADESGWYRFEHVAPGSCRIVATAPRRLEGRSRDTILVVDELDTQVDPIRLDPAQELAGRVVGPGDAPIAGAEVRARSRDRNARFDATSKSEPDGSFRIDHVPSGALRLDASAEGFRSRSLDGVDPAAGEVVVALERGLAAAVTVVDAASGDPVLQFAARLRPVDAEEDPSAGPLDRVLARGIRNAQRGQERTSESALEAPAIQRELEDRFERLRADPTAARARELRFDVGPLAAAPGGRRLFEGLEEGAYAVDVAAPGFQPASARGLDVREGQPTAELRVALERGLAVSGVVARQEDGVPIADATVELVAVDPGSALESAATKERSTSPFAWAFARPGPRGTTLLATRTDERGRFTLPSLPPGVSLLVASCEGRIAVRSDAFDLRADRDDFQLLLSAGASVHGRLRGIPAGRAADVRVFALGGSGTMKSVRAADDASYRIDALPPGEYVLRAFLGESPRALAERVDALFASADRAMTCDLELAGGESKVLDLDVDVPPLGGVEGSVLVNGAPARGHRIVLRADDAASAASGRAAQAIVDQRGSFTLKDVPAGSYTLQVLTPESRQELDRESLLIVADAVTPVHAVVDAGALTGEVRGKDGRKLAKAEGTLRILPGAKEKPADLRAYARTNRVHEVRVRAGAFAADALTPGAAIVVVELKGHPPFETTVEIPARSSCELVIEPPR